MKRQSPLNPLDPLELESLNVEFESSSAKAIITWATETFGNGLSLACSFQECAIIDLVVQVDPDVEVVFVDTGCHFPETIVFMENLRRLFGLNLRVVGPEAEAAVCIPGSEQCCHLRKVRPLNKALGGRAAWMTGLKRCDAETRANAPIVSWDATRNLVKVNPLANWSEHDLGRYVTEHRLPVHPLTLEGYLSIGCSPCTSRVLPGGERRSGRWAGTDQTECGLHS